MPKYIIWFIYYSMTGEPHHVRTYIFKENDSISFYLYNVGYWKWHVDHVIKERVSEESPNLKHGRNVDAVYLISRKNDRGIIHISNSVTFITMFMDGYAF